MKLKKDLGLLATFCISSGAMISSGLFILPALAYAALGPAVIIAYAVASILALPTILSKAELGTAMPKSGGIYFFADRSMGPLMGTLGGLAAWISLAFKSAFALLGMSIFVGLLFPEISQLQIKLIASGFCILFAIININGVKFSGKAQIYIVLLLLLFLIIYSFFGSFKVNLSHFTQSFTFDFHAILATAGLVFVSFSGTTKIAAVAGEIRDPVRNLPLGMFLSWGIVSLLYIVVIFVTVGVVSPDILRSSLTPISIGGDIILGQFGLVIMTAAAILAFISTGNAGLLASSRTPMAMGTDGLLPKIFSRISTKNRTPWFSIMVTTGLMIATILFLDLENFVKTASTLKLLLFIMANLSLIFMREGNLKHYHPKYKAPFYPWLQIAGILGYIFVIFKMGTTPIIISSIFVAIGIGWYFIYAHGKIKREYAFLHILERITKIKHTDQLLEEELREILNERDNVSEERFEYKLQKSIFVDLEEYLPLKDLNQMIATLLAKRIRISKDKLYKRLMHKECQPEIIIKPGFAIIPYVIKGRERFELAVIRTKADTFLPNHTIPVRALFIIVVSFSEKYFYYHSILWLIKIVKTLEIESDWNSIHNTDQLKEVILSAWDKVKGEDIS